MITDNRIILKKKNTNTYNTLINLEKTKTSVHLVPSKKGDDTLLVDISDKQYTFHSKYDPKREAQTFIEKYKDLSATNHILFIGTGLGYHIEMILKIFPHISFSIYEPNPEILYAFLSKVNLSKYREEQIQEIYTNLSEINNFDKLVDIITVNSTIIEFPLTIQLYSKEIEEFNTILKEALKQKKLTIGTDASFQQRWITNSIINFSEIVKCPNFFTDINSTSLQEKPIILVSAGPSLSLEIENLRKIKKEGRAYIFAVGSAVNALIEADILPDAFFSYDPTTINAKVVEKIKEKQLPIPLIFGSSIGHEVLENYPGPKFHFLTTQDSFSHQILGEDISNTVPDASSVAVLTLYILLKLKIHTIILVGQNLGYLNQKRYADEISYDFINNELSEIEKQNQIFVEDVHGGKIETSEAFLRMKSDFENIIRSFNSQSEIINSTKNGARIQGTTYMDMDGVILTKLQQTNIVSTEWLKGESHYSMNQIQMNFTKFEKSFDEMIHSFQEASLVQKEIIEDYNRGIFSKLDKQFNRFDKAFHKLESTSFFSIIIGPVTRVQYKEFVRRSHEVNAVHLPRQKAEKFIEIFARYMRTILATIAFIQPAFKQLKDSNIFNEKENV